MVYVRLFPSHNGNCLFVKLSWILMEILQYKNIFQFISQAVLAPWGLPRPRCNILHLILLNLMRFPGTHFLSLSRSLWLASHNSDVATTPFNMVTPSNLLRMNSFLPCMWLIKLLNNICPNMDPWRTPLVIDVHWHFEPLTTALWMWPSNKFLIHLTVYHWIHLPAIQREGYCEATMSNTTEVYIYSSSFVHKCSHFMIEGH